MPARRILARAMLAWSGAGRAKNDLSGPNGAKWAKARQKRNLDEGRGGRPYFALAGVSVFRFLPPTLFLKGRNIKG